MELTQQSSLKSTASRLGLGYFLLIAITQSLTVVFSIGMQILLPALYENIILNWLITYLPLYLAAFPVFLLLTRSLPSLPANEEYAKPTIGGAIKCLVICFGFMYFFNLLSSFINVFLSYVFGTDMINPLLETAGANSMIMNIIIGVIIAPIGEEILFRYIPFKKLRAYGDKVYIIFSATCFALFHGNISQMLYAFALGAVFSYVLCRTGKLRYTVLLHMIINLMGLVVAPLIAKSETATMFLGLFVMIIIPVGLTMFCVLWQRRHLHFAPPSVDLPLHPWREVFFNSGMLANAVMCFAMVIIIIITPIFM